MRTLLIVALGLVSVPAWADMFMQARCPQHRVEWRGPKRSSHAAFRDADAHNRAHRGHDARVVMVDHETASIEPSTKTQ
jgi:hypothetical protein